MPIITPKQRLQLLRLWEASAELRAKSSECERQIAEILGQDDPGNIIAELEGGSSSVADFDKALAMDGVIVSAG